MYHYGIIGNPLEHSFSHDYFTRKFAEENIKADYRTYSLTSAADALPLIATLDGINVTHPFKQAIMPLLDSLDPTAEEIGAVNVIYCRRGYNTDCIGFMESIRKMIHPSDKQALVLGTGGAARAILYALNRMDITTTLVSRTPTSGQLAYADLTKEIMESHSVIVNCTPLGMYPAVEQCPNMPWQLIDRRHLVYDCIYNPEETLLLRLCRERGARTMNGLRMLELQAEEAWKIWNKSL